MQKRVSAIILAADSAVSGSAEHYRTTDCLRLEQRATQDRMDSAALAGLEVIHHEQCASYFRSAIFAALFRVARIVRSTVDRSSGIRRVALARVAIEGLRERRTTLDQVLGGVREGLASTFTTATKCTRVWAICATVRRGCAADYESVACLGGLVAGSASVPNVAGRTLSITGWSKLHQQGGQRDRDVAQAGCGRWNRGPESDGAETSSHPVTAAILPGRCVGGKAVECRGTDGLAPAIATLSIETRFPRYRIGSSRLLAVLDRAATQLRYASSGSGSLRVGQDADLLEKSIVGRLPAGPVTQSREQRIVALGLVVLCGEQNQEQLRPQILLAAYTVGTDSDPQAASGRDGAGRWHGHCDFAYLPHTEVARTDRKLCRAAEAGQSADQNMRALSDGGLPQDGRHLQLADTRWTTQRVVRLGGQQGKRSTAQALPATRGPASAATPPSADACVFRIVDYRRSSTIDRGPSQDDSNDLTPLLPFDQYAQTLRGFRPVDPAVSYRQFVDQIVSQIARSLSIPRDILNDLEGGDE